MRPRSYALFASLLSFTLLAAAAALALEEMRVQVKEAEVRQTPSFLSPIVTKLPYGAQVHVLVQSSGWLNVNAEGVSGFVHESAVSRQVAQLKPGKPLNVGSAGHEIGLVGKEVRLPTNVRDLLEEPPLKEEIPQANQGLPKQLEKLYISAHPYASFAGIDRMEAYSVSDEQIQAFLQAGGLTPGGK